MAKGIRVISDNLRFIAVMGSFPSIDCLKIAHPIPMIKMPKTAPIKRRTEKSINADLFVLSVVFTSKLVLSLVIRFRVIFRNKFILYHKTPL